MPASPEDFGQLKLKFVDPIQHDYEVIRPVVLFEERVTRRAQETGVERTQVGDKARRFMEQGMLGLLDARPQRSGRPAQPFPEAVAAHILYLKQLYPPIHYREIVRIVGHKFGYRTHHHQVKDFLDRYAPPVQLRLPFTEFHEHDDSYAARCAVVRMWAEGWNKTSIAGCLHLSERQVRRILRTFEQEGFAGLEDRRTRPVDHPANQLTLPLFRDVLEIQREYPKAGRFRVRGLLGQRTGEPPPSPASVGRAMAVNRRFHEAADAWQSDRGQATGEEAARYLLYRPHYQHHMWFIDIRYLVKLEGQWVYSICIIDGYSRQILAGAASLHQDQTAVLQVLFAALSEHGAPEMIVSDNGKVFLATDYRTILAALNVEPKYIEKGSPWQNLIEAQFKVQLRLADHHFEQAKTLEQIQQRHAQFIETFNTTPHWAHHDRTDDKETPAQVLTWVRGTPIDPDKLRRLFQQVRFSRTVNRHGFVSVQRFYIYAEKGLARQRVSVWIYEGQLRIEYQQTLLAEYDCQWDRRHQLRDVRRPTLYPTPFHSPQLELFELTEEQWTKVYERTLLRRPKAPVPALQQLRLPFIEVACLLLFYSLAG